MDNIISLKQVERNFGEVRAVRGVSFTIRRGELFGLVGPDGAGKSTTIRMLCGLIRPGAGSAEVLGMDTVKSKKTIQQKIGYLSQKFSLYGDLTIDENIEFFADIHQVKDYSKRREELLEFTRLKPFRKRYADKLSGGMKQKLALACSLIHKPEILFLDEPTTGVDPVSRRDFWKILSGLSGENITVVMSTPYLDEAERCHRIALMHKGKILKIGSPKQIKHETGIRTLEVVTDDIKSDAPKIKTLLNADVQLFGDRIHIIITEPDISVNEFAEKIISAGIHLIDYREMTPSLENVFIHVVQSGGNYT